MSALVIYSVFLIAVAFYFWFLYINIYFKVKKKADRKAGTILISTRCQIGQEVQKWRQGWDTGRTYNEWSSWRLHEKSPGLCFPRGPAPELRRAGPGRAGRTGPPAAGAAPLAPPRPRPQPGPAAPRGADPPRPGQRRRGAERSQAPRERMAPPPGPAVPGPLAVLDPTGEPGACPAGCESGGTERQPAAGMDGRDAPGSAPLPRCFSPWRGTGRDGDYARAEPRRAAVQGRSARDRRRGAHCRWSARV